MSSGFLLIFGKYINEDYSDNLINGIYLQTYGGGPEGGFVYCSDNQIYSVHREWFKPFNIKKISFDENDVFFMTEVLFANKFLS